MKISFLYGQWCLSFRGSLDFQGLWQDPRGLSGSELGIIRTAEEMVKLGHDVHMYTISKDTEYHGIKIHPIAEADTAETDAWVSWNEPELLRGLKGFRVCEQMLNSFEYCKLGFDDHVDLWCSPSDNHREMVLGMEHDHDLQIDGSPRGLYKANPDKWVTVMLGCDPERYVGRAEKVPGRVVYCSSPDRGLHWLLQEWHKIKSAVPHATLKIFYRLKPWLDTMHGMKYHHPPRPDLESLRSRAFYIEECLRRMPDKGIEVCDSVCREQIEREMSAAEVLAYPCDTIRYSEGFSCTILECCAARACPVILDTDALGSIYRDACVVVPRDDLSGWSDAVIRALKDSEFRQGINDRAEAFAKELTWAARTKQLEQLLLSRL